MLIIGGIGSLWGATVGALLVSGVNSFLNELENGIGDVSVPGGTRLVAIGALMALILLFRPQGITGGREFPLPRRAGAPAGGGWTRRRRRGGHRVRICVVGCGAVGSLFAANLARLDDVEVWAYDLAADHVDAINEHGLRLSGAGDVVGWPARDRGCRGAAAVRFRPRRDEGDAHGAAVEAAAHALRGRRRLLGAERDRQRGGDRSFTSRA